MIRKLKVHPRTCKVIGVHLNPESFPAYIEQLTPASKCLWKTVLDGADSVACNSGCVREVGLPAMLLYSY